MHKRVLHSEVLGVIEDCNGLSISLLSLRSLCLLLVLSGYGARSCVLVVYRCVTVFCSGSHCGRKLMKIGLKDDDDDETKKGCSKGEVRVATSGRMEGREDLTMDAKEIFFCVEVGE